MNWVTDLLVARRPVDAATRERLDRKGVDALRLRPGGVDLEVVAAELGQEGLGELAPGAVAGADKEHPDRGGGHRGSLLLGAAGGRDGQFEVEQLALEAIEVAALAGDRRPLVCEERREVGVDLSPLQAQASEPAGILRAESEASKRDDEAEPGEVVGAVVAIAVLPPRRGRQDADRLVEADGGRVDAGTFGELGDPHVRSRMQRS